MVYLQVKIPERNSKHDPFATCFLLLTAKSKSSGKSRFRRETPNRPVSSHFDSWFTPNSKLSQLEAFSVSNLVSITLSLRVLYLNFRKKICTFVAMVSCAAENFYIKASKHLTYALFCTNFNAQLDGLSPSFQKPQECPEIGRKISSWKMEIYVLFCLRVNLKVKVLKRNSKQESFITS